MGEGLKKINETTKVKRSRKTRKTLATAATTAASDPAAQVESFDLDDASIPPDDMSDDVPNVGINEPESKTNGKPIAKAKATPNGKAKTKANPAPPSSPTTRPTTRPTPSPSSYAHGVLYKAASSLKMIADPTRASLMLALLESGPLNVGEMGRHVKMSQPATSHHLSLMRHGSFVTPHRKGKENFYELTAKGRMLAGLVKKFVEKPE